VPGAGPAGRVRVEDVKKYAEAQKAAPAPGATAPAGFPPPPVYRTPKGYEDREERVPLRGLRRVIAQQMAASHLYTVRTLHVDEADLTELVRLRAALKPEAEAQGIKLSFLPFIFKAVIQGLKKYPALNSSLDEARQEIVKKRYYHLGMAVDTPQGLVVPVIKDADQKTLLELAAEASALAEKARTGKLAPEDVTGSTFSITNIGSIGGVFSFPIINVPDAAILGVHAIQDRPVVRDGEIVVRKMMYLSISFDHRLVDGAEAARFLKEVIRYLEQPGLLLLEAR
jgi:pyruvate dehydrogenase E2 component (dihydrolipoamide acetyltransferase)